jgi:hypothetical protein
MPRNEPGEVIAEREVVFVLRATPRRDAFVAVVMSVVFLGCSRMGDKPPWWPKEQVAKPRPADPSCSLLPTAQHARSYFWTDPEPNRCGDSVDAESHSPSPPDGPDAVPPDPSNSAQAGAARVVEAMREGFHACYRALLDNRDSCATGAVRLKFHIQCEGKIGSIEATASGVDETTVQCILDSAKQSRFQAPPQRGAVVSVPVTFVRRTVPPTATPAPDGG